jgi:hypothetical protein
MMRIIYQMIKEGKPYEDPNVDYLELLAKKNAPRWISSLKKYDLLEDLLKNVELSSR